MYPYSYPSLLSRGLGLTKAINWSSLLDGTQKTLGVINQAIPLVYQVKPLIGNAKTLFKIANVINEPASTSDTTLSVDVIDTTPINSNTSNSPIFYI